MKIFAFDSLWQMPAKTEKHAFELIREQAWDFSGAAYLAFPWATLIDAMERGTPQAEVLRQELDRLISRRARSTEAIVVSVCQHIKYRKYLETFRRAGVTDLYCSHAEIGIRFELGIRIWPFQLFPTQTPPSDRELTDEKNILESFLERDIDFSYVGAYDPRFYLTNARQIITDKLSTIPRAYVKGRGEWHYEKDVYARQIHGKSISREERDRQVQREIEYRDVMARSKFVLCPSGTGPNSIRFWEALEFGCIPILLSDRMALPGCDAEWDACVLRVPEEESAIEQIPEIVQYALSDYEKLSTRLAALRRLNGKYGMANMVEHLLEATRSQARLQMMRRGTERVLCIDARRLHPEDVTRCVEEAKVRLKRAKVEARIFVWNSEGSIQDETKIEIGQGCDPLAFLDIRQPFAWVFDWRNVSLPLVRDLAQIVIQPRSGDSARPYGQPKVESHIHALYGGFDLSLITSVFKGRRFLPRFLDSISAYTNKQVIEHLMIVAASPEDELSVIAERHQQCGANISVVWLPRDPGLYEVWNLGISLSSGRYVGNANLDDFRAPQQTALLVDMLDTMPEADVASTAIAVATDPSGDWSRLDEYPAWFTNIADKTYSGKDLFRVGGDGQICSYNIPHCLPIWRRSLHYLYGYFDEQRFGPSADWEFWLRCGASGVRFAHLNEVLGIYYKNESTYWRRNPDTWRLERNVVQRHFMAATLLSRYNGSLVSLHVEILAEHRRRRSFLGVLIAAFHIAQTQRGALNQLVLRYLNLALARATGLDGNVVLDCILSLALLDHSLPTAVALMLNELLEEADRLGDKRAKGKIMALSWEAYVLFQRPSPEISPSIPSRPLTALAYGETFLIKEDAERNEKQKSAAYERYESVSNRTSHCHVTP